MARADAPARRGRPTGAGRWRGARAGRGSTSDLVLQDFIGSSCPLPAAVTSAGHLSVAETSCNTLLSGAPATMTVDGSGTLLAEDLVVDVSGTVLLRGTTNSYSVAFTGTRR